MLPTTAAWRRAHGASGTRPVTSRMGFLGIIWPSVNVSEIDDLDEKVAHLNTDIMRLSAGDAPTFDTPAWDEWHKRRLLIRNFKWDWTAWRQTWTYWKSEMYTEWSRHGEEPRFQFEAFKRDYNESVRSFKENWGDTTAEKEKPIGKVKAGEIQDFTDLIVFGIAAYIGVNVLQLAAKGKKRKKRK